MAARSLPRATDASPRSLGAWKASIDVERTALITFVLVIVAVVVIPPLVFLIWTSVTPTERGAPATLTLTHYAAIFGDASLLPLLYNTVLFSAGSSFFSLLLGGILAFAVVRTNMPLKSLMNVSMILLLAFPGVIYTLAWILLLNPNGVITGWVTGLLGLAQAPINVHSLWGMVFVEGLNWMPLTFFLMVALFRFMDRSLEESAFISGANGFNTMARITLPLMLPGLVSIFILNFMRGLEAFEVPALIGIPGRVEVLVSEIFLLVRAFPAQYGIASAFSVVLIGMIMLCLLGYSRMTRVAAKYQTVRGKGFTPGVLDLGRWRWPLAVSLAVLVFVALVLPFSSIAWASFLPFYQVPSARAFNFLTLDNYTRILQLSSVGVSVQNSTLVAVGAATATMLITSLGAWLVVRTRSSSAWLLDLLIMTPLVIPGIVMAVAMLRTYITLPIPIFGTLWILLIAYVASFLPYGMRYAHPGILQIHEELEESAYLSGASRVRVFWRIVLPLIRPALFGGWLFIFLVAFRELSRSLLLHGLDSKVVAVTLFDFWDDGQIGQMGAFSVVLSLGLFAVGLLAHHLIGRSQVVVRD